MNAPRVKVTLLEPMAVIDGRPAMFLRDAFGGEVPLSCAYPPLELMWAAALLRDAGVAVELLPANVLGWAHPRVAAHLRGAPPDYILIPSAWGSLDDDLRLIHRLRDALPRARILLSGPNVTAEPEAALRAGPLDFVILGEPEEPLLALATGKTASEIPNLAWLDGDRLVQTPRSLLTGFEHYPLPARDLVDLSRYTVPFARRLPATTMHTTRGCRGTCTFCPSQIWHQRQICARPLDVVMEEIDELVLRYGIKELVMRDETFTWDRDRVLEFCERLRPRNYDIGWRVFGTVDTVDPELLTAMAGAGCTQVCYGFESGVDAILSQTGKGTTVAQGTAAARWTHEADMEVAGTFVVGLEGETHDTVSQSIRFALDNDLDYVQVNPAAPLPGTGFGKRHARAGLDSDPRRFRWFGARTGETATLGPDDIVREVRRFYRRVYFRPGYVLGRVRSKRGLRALYSHGRMAGRMAAFVIFPRLQGFTS